MAICPDPERVVAALGPRQQFAQGDVACAYGALLGGCTFFGGYPITPATEVAEAMARLAIGMQTTNTASLPAPR